MGFVTEPLSDQQRATMWLEGSGGEQLRRDSPRSYTELVAAAMDENEDIIDLDSLEHINMDVPRTATVHPRFELAPECSELDRGDRTPVELAQWLVTILPEDQSLVMPLLRLLSAICVRSPHRGYTQGMNFVAAVLLLHVPEEEAFWCLVGIQDILVPQLWDEPSRIGRVVELQLLDRVLSNSAPHLAKRLGCIDTGCFATSWVDTLFAGTWPSDVAAWCFDGLLCPKYPAALQRIIFAYLETVEDFLVRRRLLNMQTKVFIRVVPLPAVNTLTATKAALLHVTERQGVSEAPAMDPFEVMLTMQRVRDGPPSGWTPETKDRMMSRAFAFGYVDDDSIARERARLTRRAHMKATRMRRMQELDALFLEFDQDGNGQIDRTEMEALVLHIFGGVDTLDNEECVRGEGWHNLAAAVFELSDLDGDGTLSRQEFERVATMLSPALGAALRLGRIGSGSGLESSSEDLSDAAVPAVRGRSTTLGSKQARLRQLYNLFASNEHGQLETDGLVMLIETIHSAERALTADSMDEIRCDGAVSSSNSSRAAAEHEAQMIRQFISNDRKRTRGEDVRANILAPTEAKYPPGYLVRYVGLDLMQIKQLALQGDASKQPGTDVASTDGREALASLSFDEFGVAAAHFPILGLGTTLLLEAMDPERAMATRRFGDRSGIGSSGILARETSQLSAMMISVVRCERLHVRGELTQHTEYVVRVESEETSFTCRRRYSHFLALHQKILAESSLSDKERSSLEDTFPAKVLIKLGWQVESTRLRQLGAYLNAVQALTTGGQSAKAWLFEFLTCASIDKAGSLQGSCYLQ